MQALEWAAACVLEILPQPGLGRTHDQTLDVFLEARLKQRSGKLSASQIANLDLTPCQRIIAVSDMRINGAEMTAIVQICYHFRNRLIGSVRGKCVAVML